MTNYGRLYEIDIILTLKLTTGRFKNLDRSPACAVIIQHRSANGQAQNKLYPTPHLSKQRQKTLIRGRVCTLQGGCKLGFGVNIWQKHVRKSFLYLQHNTNNTNTRFMYHKSHSRSPSIDRLLSQINPYDSNGA